MRSGLMVVLLCITVAMAVYPQQSAERRRQEAIEQALREIAVKDHTIPNVIYNGMTIDHVESILQERVVVSCMSFQWPTGYDCVSYHGSYAIFWSGMVFQRPVVIGFAAMSDRVIRGNVLR